jgi:hypothetical protein
MPNWKKVITSGSDAALNSLLVTNGITGSLLGTASTASFVTGSNVYGPYGSNSVLTASYALNGGVTQLLAGPNVTLSPTNGQGQVTISSTGGGGPSFNTATGSYGSFYDTTTQTNVAGTARSMSLNTTDITNGVSISGSTSPFNTYIKVANAGVYDIQFSAQIDKTDSGTDEIWIWIRKNGTNLSDSATSVQLVGNGAHYVAAWNFFVNAAAGDYFQLMWYSPDANVRLHAEPAFGVVPGIPSLIVTANRVDQFLSNTGSFSGSFTGTLTGTASYATQALSASFSSTSSYVNTLNQNVTVNGNFNSLGTGVIGSAISLSSYTIDDGVSSMMDYDQIDLWSAYTVTGEILWNEPINETILRGQLVTKTPGGWVLAENKTSQGIFSYMLGIALDNAAIGDRAPILLKGMVTTTYNIDQSSADSGTPVYMDGAISGGSGNMSSIPQTHPGFTVRVVGYTYINSSIQSSGNYVLRFDPSSTWVEL